MKIDSQKAWRFILKEKWVKDIESHKEFLEMPISLPNSYVEIAREKLNQTFEEWLKDQDLLQDD